MTKKLMMMFATVAAALCAWAETETVGGYTWTYQINGDTAEIYNNSFVAISPLPTGAVTIPSTLGGKPVTSVGDYAFSGCSGLTSVTIPDSVTSIGYSGFDNCSGLTNVTIGNGVKSIGYRAFYNCSGLTSVTIPDSVASIGDFAFYNCSGLTSVTIPDSVTSIGERAFCNCRSLAYVTISASVASIRRRAFGDCENLMSIVVANENTKYSSKNGLLLSKDGETLIQGVNGDVTIPDSVTTIDDYAFHCCKGLTSITVGKDNALYSTQNGLLLSKDGKVLVRGVNGDVVIPDGVTIIGDFAFYGCTGLEDVAIPDSVERISSSSFLDCSDSLFDTVMVPGARLADGWVIGHSWPTPNDIVLNGVRGIAERAFAGCSSLTSVTIPDSVTSIGPYAFYECCDLTSVTIGKGVANIEASAFRYCSSLTCVMIPDGVVNIGDAAFDTCGLVSVTIPDSVTNIGMYAFYNCRRLASMSMGKCVRNIGKYALFGCTNVTSVTIPQWICSETLSSVFPSYQSITNIVIADGVTYIERSLFAGCRNLMNVSIPESVTSIAEGTFSQCPDLLFDMTTISGVKLVDGWAIGKTGVLSGALDLTGIRGIGGGAFLNNTDLTSVVIPGSAHSIGYKAFYGCSGLTSVVIPNSVTSIGAYAFSGCSSLKSVVIPQCLCSPGIRSALPCYQSITNVVIADGSTSVGAYMFYGFDSLGSVTIPGSVTNIGRSAFEDCTNLTAVAITDIAAWCKVEFENILANPLCYAHNLYLDGELVRDVEVPEGLSEVGSFAFYGCSCLTHVMIPSSVTNVRDYAFSGCSGLTSVAMPDSLSSIGEGVFDDCRSLVSLTIPDVVVNIPDYAFRDCSNLTNIVIPSSVTNVGEEAFACCRSLTTMTIPDGVINIGDYAFYGCESLVSVTIPEGVASIGEGVFCECRSLASVTIPDGVESIGEHAFEGCESLASVMIPGSVGEIGYCAFFGCAWLGNVTMLDSFFLGSTPDGRWWIHYCDIGDHAFGDCLSLTNVVMGFGVRRIGDGAFSSCEMLKGVTIPNTVEYIGADAFESCSGLTNVEFGGNAPDLGESVFSNVNSQCVVRVSRDSTGWGVSIPGEWHGVWIEYDLRVALTFNSNGGTVVTPGTQDYVPGQTFGQFPVPTRRGYTFQGWWTEAVNGIRMTEATQVPAADMELFAHWKPITYYVRFHANGGSGADVDQPFVFDVRQALRTHTFTRTGFAFTGWATTPSGQVRYAENKTVVNLEEVEGHIVDLYAVWSGVGYSVRFDSNGGTGIMDNQTIAVGETQNLWPCAFARAGYAFVGWALSPTEAEAKKVAYRDGQAVRNLATSNGADISLYAVWVAKENTVRITFDANGGSVAPDYWDCVINTAVESFPTPTRPGFTFAGWWTAKTGGTRVASIASVTSSKTFYAHWTENGGVEPGDGSYVVTFNANGGSVSPTSRTVSGGSAVGTLPTPSRTGYRPLGWFTAASGGVAVTAATKVTGKVTYYAHWQPVYAIRFHRNDASDEKTAAYDFDYGVETHLPSLAKLGWARRGCDFLGWATSRANADAGKVWKKDWAAVASPVAAGETLDVYAVWALKPNSYAIQFIRNDGAGTWRTVGFNYGEKTRMPSVANGLQWARRGYDFKGWALTTADANAGKVWKEDWAYVATPVKAGEVLTVYAVWALKPGYYQVRFNKNDGTGKWRTLGFECDKSTKLSTIAGLGWERPDCTFRGWASNKANADAGKVWKPDGEWVTNATAEGRTLSIYAIWE